MPEDARPADAPRRLLRQAGIVGAMTLLSRLTGVLVQITTNGVLGATRIGDAYQVAWRLPNMLRRFTAEGTMTAALLPTLAEVEARDGEPAARTFVKDFLGSLAWVLGLLALLGILAMTPLIGLQMLGKLAPDQPFLQQLQVFGAVLAGRTAFPPDVALATTLARLMFPYLLLVSLTAGMAAVLNLREKFALAASVSTFFNLSFLAFAWVWMALLPAWRQPDRAALVFALAVLAGGLVQLLVLVPAYRRLGFRLQPRLRLSNPDVRLALRRMGPGILAGGIHPINVLVSTSLASQLGDGAQTVLNTSNILGELVLGLFAMSMATVSLPTMSRQAAAGDLEGVRGSYAAALRGTAFLALPASVGLAVLASPIVAFLFQRGRFDGAAVAWTAETLPYQALGILFIASARISTQALNALKDYRGPAQAALLGFTANILLSLALMGPLGTRGMALANSLAGLAGLLYLVHRLRGSLGRLPVRDVGRGWLTMAGAALGMGLLTAVGAGLLGLGPNRGTLALALRLFPLMALGALAYFAAATTLRLPEAHGLLGAVKRRLGR